MNYLFLALAIIFETVATLSLKQSEGFTKLIPSIVVVIGYGAAFFFLSQVMKTLPVGLVYAIWSGVGIVIVSVVGHFYFKQILDLPALLGIGFIIAGVAVINLFSKSVAH